jgi:hypothetical protein
MVQRLAKEDGCASGREAGATLNTQNSTLSLPSQTVGLNK